MTRRPGTSEHRWPLEGFRDRDGGEEMIHQGGVVKAAFFEERFVSFSSQRFSSGASVPSITNMTLAACHTGKP